MVTRYVPVEGGELAYELGAGRTEPVLAVHGVSSQRRLFDWLHAAAPALTLLRPDLRGRADSVAVAGGAGLDRHVADLVALLDAVGLDRVHVCGMSMGGFVAVRLAAAHPERVRSLVLVDGGPPTAVPPGATAASMPALFADRLARLDRVWAGTEEYRDYFLARTAPMLDRDDPLLPRYLEHDLRDGVVRLSGPALLADATDAFFGPNPWREVTVPMRLLHAEFGSGAGTPPAYPPAALEPVRAALTECRPVPGVDHAGSIMTPTGAAATAEMISRALAG